VDLASQAASVGALADPTRLALYEYVVARPEPVGREEAASGVGVALHTAKFHLDRLVEAGLLTTEFRRLGGRSGPGAGRPSKLYRRAEAQVAVSLPDRKYDLVGDILASGVERAAEGADLAAALEDAAAEAGRAAAAPGDLTTFTEALAGLGFEPRLEDDTVLLANCPFDTLA
jgi:predicted ArsR family transcriptional regulator